MNENPQHSLPDVVLFDGVCNLCTVSVRFILKHEVQPRLRFASVQSVVGARLMRQFGFNPDNPHTFVLVENGVAHVKSEAALRLAGQLRLPWRLARLGLILPRAWRDGCYDIIARNRYRWFGRQDTCMVPTHATAGRFLEDQ